MTSPYLRLLRPRQWVKNLLVFAGPAAGAALDEPEFLLRSTTMFVAFCLAASGMYCLNDAADHVADQLHPVKRTRPVASGDIAPGPARRLGLVLVVAALLVAATTGDPEPVVLIALYVALMVAYTRWLRRIPVVELLTLTLGFVFRAVGGLVGTSVGPSRWFLLVTSAGALFLVAGKRLAELDLDDASSHRRSLAHYGRSTLQQVRLAAAGLAVLGYTSWSFTRELPSGAPAWYQLSVVPFAAALLRYAKVHDAMDHPNPEDVLLGDRWLQVLLAVLIVLVTMGIYLEPGRA